MPLREKLISIIVDSRIKLITLVHISTPCALIIGVYRTLEFSLEFLRLLDFVTWFWSDVILSNFSSSITRRCKDKFSLSLNAKRTSNSLKTEEI